MEPYRSLVPATESARPSGPRIDLQCLPGDDADDLASPEGLRDWIVPVIGEWYADHRRVLLAGEAAHLLAPWGGRGLNSGVIDATDPATTIRRAVARMRSERPERPEASRVAPHFPPAGSGLPTDPRRRL